MVPLMGFAFTNLRLLLLSLLARLQITSIHASSTTYTALSFGPVPRLVLSPIPPVMLDSFGLFPSPSEDQDRPTVLWELTKLRDGWSMDTTLGRGEVAGSGGAGERDPVGGNAILIGGNKQMMYAKDLANPTFESVKVHSDVLSVAMINVVSFYFRKNDGHHIPLTADHIVYDSCSLQSLPRSLATYQNEAIVGLRSSQIMHYDFRQPLSKSGSVRGSLSKSVTNIQVFDESSSGVGFGGGRGLLAGGMGNEVCFGALCEWEGGTGKANGLLSFGLFYPALALVPGYEIRHSSASHSIWWTRQ